MLTGEFLRLSARRAPERLAIIGTDRRLTYRELDLEANRFAHGLLSLRAGSDTRAAIISANRPEYAIAYFGAARAGVLLAHLSARSTTDNLVYMLDRSAPTSWFTRPVPRPRSAKRADGCRISRTGSCLIARRQTKIRGSRYR